MTLDTRRKLRLSTWWASMSSGFIRSGMAARPSTVAIQPCCSSSGHCGSAWSDTIRSTSRLMQYDGKITCQWVPRSNVRKMMKVPHLSPPWSYSPSFSPTHLNSHLHPSMRASSTVRTLTHTPIHENTTIARTTTTTQPKRKRRQRQRHMHIQTHKNTTIEMTTTTTKPQRHKRREWLCRLWEQWARYPW